MNSNSGRLDIIRARWACGVVALATTMAYGCTGGPSEGGATEPDQDEVETSEEPLLGSVTYGSDCSARQKTFLNNAMKWGRIAASSKLMQACLANLNTTVTNFHAPYMPCIGADPGWDQSSAAQSALVSFKVLSPNPLTINCTGGAGNASTFLGTWDTTAESFSWGAWFVGKDTAAGSNPANPAWPYSQAIAIIWHEVMHNYGYSHGDNDDNARAKTACGYTPDVTYDFQHNSMPYLIQDCMQSVINSSGVNNVCGNTSTCGSNGLAIRTGFDENSPCECVPDPRAPGAKVTFYGGNTMRNEGKVDWDWGYWKGDCKKSEAVTGLSVATGGNFTHAGLCREEFINGVYQATLSQPGDQQRARHWFDYDWDYGNYKLECGSNEYISGLSQNPSSPYKFHGIRCSSGAAATNICETRQVGGGNFRGTTLVGDWDSGYYKTECDLGFVAVGVSVSPSTGQPNKLMCCRR